MSNEQPTAGQPANGQAAKQPATRTQQDIEKDRRAIAALLLPTLKKGPASGTVHIRLDDLATLCGLDITKLMNPTESDKDTEIVLLRKQLEESKKELQANSITLDEAKKQIAQQEQTIGELIEEQAATTAPPVAKPAPPIAAAEVADDELAGDE